MFTYADLAKLQAQSLKMQGHIRHQTYSPEMEKTLRRFSSWEVAELIFKPNPSTLRGRMAAVPHGVVGEKLPAPVEYVEERDRPVRSGQFHRRVDLHHRQPPACRGDGVTLTGVLFLAPSQRGDCGFELRALGGTG